MSFRYTVQRCKNPKQSIHALLTDKFIKWYWNLYFYITSCFKHRSWRRVNLVQTRLVNNAQLHQSHSNCFVFPFMAPINSHYITFVTACWFSHLPSKLANLLDLHMLKAEEGGKKEESVDLIWKSDKDFHAYTPQKKSTENTWDSVL